MSAYAYPAIFKKEDTGYSISFPDMKNCFSSAPTLDKAIEMAADVLSLMLCAKEDGNEEIPKSSAISAFLPSENETVYMIGCHTDAYREQLKVEQSDNPCIKCPAKKEYYQLPSCPNCGTRNLYMLTKYHWVQCPSCGSEFGIPMCILGTCFHDLNKQKYNIAVQGSFTKKHIIDFAKILKIRSVDLYHLLKNEPVYFSGLSYADVYYALKLSETADFQLQISPEFTKYSKLESCFNV